MIVDGQYIDAQRDIPLQWCGSKNQRVIDVKQTLKNKEIVLWNNTNQIMTKQNVL